MFNIPNLFTASNLLCGVLSLIFCFMGKPDWACYAIFGGAVLDFFDGFLARKLNLQGEMGKQLDSLADMVTFGVAPGILVFTVLAYKSVLAIPELALGFPIDLHVDHLRIMGIYFTELFHPTQIHGLYESSASLRFIPFIGLFIPFMSMFRLAKFNLDTRQSESFIGLPTPANTIFFTSFPLIMLYGEANDLREIFLSYPFVIGSVIVMSLLLVAELPLFSLKFKHFRWTGNEIRYIFLLTCAILIPTMLIWSIPIIILLYILLSLIAFIFAKKQTHEI